MSPRKASPRKNKSPSRKSPDRISYKFQNNQFGLTPMLVKSNFGMYGNNEVSVGKSQAMSPERLIKAEFTPH